MYKIFWILLWVFLRTCSYVKTLIKLLGLVKMSVITLSFHAEGWKQYPLSPCECIGVVGWKNKSSHHAHNDQCKRATPSFLEWMLYVHITSTLVPLHIPRLPHGQGIEANWLLRRASLSHIKDDSNQLNSKQASSPFYGFPQNPLEISLTDEVLT